MLGSRRGGVAGVERLGDGLEVGFGEEAADRALQLDEGGRDLGRELLHLEDRDRPVGVLRDHGEVDDPDEALLDELGERRGDVAGEAVAGEVDHDVLDGSDTGLGHGRLHGDVGTG